MKTPNNHGSILNFLSTAATVIIAVVFIFNTMVIQRLFRDYQRLELSQQVFNLTHEVFKIVVHHGYERGRVNVVLNYQGDTRNMAEYKTFIAKHRNKGKSQLKKLFKDLETSDVRFDQQVYIQIKQSLEITQQLRSIYLEQLELPFNQRDHSLDDRWFKHMSSRVEMLNQLAFSFFGSQTDVMMLGREIELALLLSQLRDNAGPVVSHLKAATFNRNSLNNDIRQEIDFRRLKVKFLVSRLHILGKYTLPQSIIDEIDQFDEFYRQKILAIAQVIAVTNWETPKEPEAYTDYLKNGVAALQQLNKISSQIFELGLARYDEEMSSALIKIIGTGAISIFIFFIVFTNLVQIYNRIYKRIRQSAHIMNELSNNNTSFKLQVPVQNDEIGDLELGLERFRNNLIEQEKAQKKFKILATQDSMTHLLNHEKILERLDLFHKESKRYDQPYSILMIDIDYFKRINDENGHQVGDQVIKQLAQILSNSIRSTDALGRYGGEEFLIILSHTSIQSAVLLAEQLRCSIESHNFLSLESPVTVSIGVAMVQNNLKPEEIITLADEQLYRAKKGGRNRVCSG